MVKIAVIGAGINGLTCALKIKEKFKDCDVTLISNQFSPNTTGDGSGGLWLPFICGDTPDHQLTKWGGETYKHLHNLWLAGGYGVCLVPMYDLYTNANNFRRPVWANVVYGYTELGPKELNYLSGFYSTKYSAGFTFASFIVTATTFLELYYKRFQELKGQIVEAEVTSLEDPILDDFQVLVNCTGLGARYLVPDSEVFPVRGQVTRVIAPWINASVIDEDSGFYILPNAETCVLGGTHQEHDYNRSIDPVDTDFIKKGCEAMVPGLKHAKLVNQWVGLRPGRSQVRLEPEMLGAKLCIHNYGHGGSGLTLYWGCATEVVQILKEHLQNEKVMSKL